MPWTTYLVTPSQYTLARDQLVIHSDFQLPTHHRLLDELVARRYDMHEMLCLPVSDEPIHVYLFESAEQFRRFVSLYHPNFPPRRAFFLETDDRLQVYAQWGDRVAEDLRHEVTHGYLHSVVPNVPVWLDEGLAEYSEAPRASRGLNRANLEQLVQRRAQGWQPNLVRLEKLPPREDMTQLDYSESWAWVHYLLEAGPGQRMVLRQFLNEMRGNPRGPVPISARLRQILDRPPEEALLAHLASVVEGKDAPHDVSFAPPASNAPDMSETPFSGDEGGL
jgi:hypothetical protein